MREITRFRIGLLLLKICLRWPVVTPIVLPFQKWWMGHN